MKKTCALLLIILLFYSVNTVSAAEPIEATVNGERVRFDQPPIVVDGRILVPIRAIAEKMGAYVDWGGNDRSVRIEYYDHIIILGNNSVSMRVINRVKQTEDIVTLDVPPIIHSARTLLPIRAIVETLGYTINWNATSRTISIAPQTRTGVTHDGVAWTYTGGIVEGEYYGRGQTVWDNGKVYVGDYIDGVFHGKGRIEWENGDWYDGDWVEGLWTGQGTYTHSDGTVLTGRWVDCKFVGN